jgi:hypothetical protein
LPSSSVARAHGLIYRLPQDGVSAQYELQSTTRLGTKVTGSLTMSSVGSSEYDSRPCRWIEVVWRTQTDLGGGSAVAFKLLIPEKQLQLGGSPFENIVKGYVKVGKGDARELAADDELGPLPFFLSGPIMMTSKLEPKAIDCALGSVQCSGVKGMTEIKRGNEPSRVAFETRLHDRAPFGVISCRMRIADGDEDRAESIHLRLTKVGANAKSVLPDVGDE